MHRSDVLEYHTLTLLKMIMLCLLHTLFNAEYAVCCEAGMCDLIWCDSIISVQADQWLSRGRCTFNNVSFKLCSLLVL